ncbi:MAG: hypothetical protein ACK53F_06485, partial [Betaproteobacteria bacterium]
MVTPNIGRQRKKEDTREDFVETRTLFWQNHIELTVRSSENFLLDKKTPTAGGRLFKNWGLSPLLPILRRSPHK